MLFKIIFCERNLFDYPYSRKDIPDGHSFSPVRRARIGLAKPKPSSSPAVVHVVEPAGPTGPGARLCRALPVGCAPLSRAGGAIK